MRAEYRRKSTGAPPTQCHPRHSAAWNVHVPESGAALLNTLLAMLVLSMMTAVLYNHLSELQDSLAIRTWKVRAEAAAESAIVQAGLKLTDDSSWRAGEDTSPEHQLRLGDAGARLTTEHIRPPDMIRLTAVGRYRRSRSRIVQEAQLADISLFALAARKRINLDFGTALDGPVTAVEGITLGRGVGMAPENRGISLICGRDVTVSGYYPTVRVFQSAVPPPDVPNIDLDMMKAKYETRIANSALTDAKIAGRSILRDGSLTIVGGTFGDVSIFVAGDLRLMGAPQVDSKGDTPVFIVEKDLVANFSGADIRGVIYVGGKATIRGQSVITGTIIADEIDIADGVTVRSFDRDTTRKRPPASFFKRDIALSVP